MATNISTALPDLSLEEETVLTVDSLDAGAIITGMVIHFTQDLPAAQQASIFPPLFGYVNGDTPPLGVT